MYKHKLLYINVIIDKNFKKKTDIAGTNETLSSS